MVEIRQTNDYAKWFEKLRDPQARARILVRVRRLSLGNPGDVRSVGDGVSEMRIDYGPGYRVYFTWQGDVIVVLLIDKRTQQRDIEKAKTLAKQL